ncbi:hypothetical protein ABPG75_011263 [Micractinium tetrahymenae]
MDPPELPEIPVLEEHSPAPEPQSAAQRLQQLPHGEPALSLEPASAPAGSGSPPAEGEGRRWSLDTSLHSDWELLSHGAQSRCGSSPQSLLPSGYNSDAEAAPASTGVTAAARAAAALAAEAFRSARRRAEAEETAASAGLDLPPVPQPDAEPAAQPEAAAAGAEPEPQPFGSLVLPAQGPLAGVAAGAPGAPGSPSGGSAASSPRSSFEHASSRTSGHDLYSLSQDGTHDALSDHDSYIEDMMAAGEPDMDHSGHSAHDKHDGGDLEGGEGGDAELALTGKPSPAAARPAHASLHLLAAAPAATLAAAARGAYCAASSHLRALAASFGAYLARIVPAGFEVAQRVVRGMADLVDTLQAQAQARLAPLPAGLGQLASKSVAAAERVQAAVQQARKSFGLEKRIPWAKVALALGGACSIMAVLLYRSMAEQKRLASVLSRRESDLSHLLTKIAELQRNISLYQSHSRVPIVRHVSASAIGVASSCAASWPAVVVV